jgi:hypothetical protein
LQKGGKNGEIGVQQVARVGDDDVEDAEEKDIGNERVEEGSNEGEDQVAKD